MRNNNYTERLAVEVIEKAIGGTKMGELIFALLL